MDRAPSLVQGHKVRLRVVTPEGAAYDGLADFVVVPSHDGETAFFPGHAAFVGLLGSGELRFHAPEGGTHHYFVAGGVVQVVDDVVTVLAESVMPAKAVDGAKAQAELDAAMKMSSVSDDEAAIKAKAIETARAKIRIAAHVAAGG